MNNRWRLPISGRWLCNWYRWSLCLLILGLCSPEQITACSEWPLVVYAIRQYSKGRSMRTAAYSIGQLIHHRLFDYRGVIVDVDPEFMLTEEWYQQVAKSRPAKDQPWYRVLVHNAIHETYVAESNLEPDTEAEPISHPETANYFAAFEDGHYLLTKRAN